ncbi:succinate-semialdehyde dehydrogenase/glutarate-semialdehyde dehydrogenase [Amycolatopsis bartoniae]|uniref:NAD-dependent succinate-semialdehyde dehydrogenase n=1 Tax=Amycolatopsis bartoniae TaxID=941986 RepID=A0A8H9MC21_9PSEU|nr:NAD-dependent succinate-semialdehyde dehydrogenase [Amycolatopsis bartoniae]MBB2933493.1 succinate-semialdehyde dehydrogenase/glutarate-semialdehyde dehydrogenase [Amycolatopsis bartoniae]TVT07596.1 NAD-dependent succinate-semialdehyde dehydrogenase [Amycolatopsis bartoniae]GHF59878.1 NAD-dependent succinate-semialdehyde dehydrogenase [Amycolatopsis bartoniae]
MSSELIDRVPKQIFLAGRWRDAADGSRFAVQDPGNEQQLCEVADAQDADAREAIEAAVAAQEEWGATPPRERGEILRRAWQLMTDRADDIARLMTLEMGKSVEESKAEVTYAAEFFRWFSEEAVRVEGRYGRNPAGTGRMIVTKRPVGPCVLITPWNFPLAMGTRKLGPAIAAGCTMIVKPAQLTPLSMLNLAALLQEAGLPDGVLSVLPTTSASRVVSPALEDPRIRKMSFTGSTEVGRKLVEQCAPNLQRMSMELGGNAPFLVFEDASLDDAVSGAITAKMRNNGESCVAANRFHVHSSIAEEFVRRLTDEMSALKVGHGTEDGVKVGPLISADQRDKVVELVDDALSRGARATTGGKPVDGEGFFYAPTVLTDVPPDARILHEEVFGPVAPVTTFDTEDEALRLADDTEFGLVAYLFTRDLDRAIRVGERVSTGMVGINTGMVSNAAAPFGGVKQSGFGREGGDEGIEEYLDVKYLALGLKE